MNPCHLIFEVFSLCFGKQETRRQSDESEDKAEAKRVNVEVVSPEYQIRRPRVQHPTEGAAETQCQASQMSGEQFHCVGVEDAVLEAEEEPQQHGKHFG